MTKQLKDCVGLGRRSSPCSIIRRRRRDRMIQIICSVASAVWSKPFHVMAPRLWNGSKASLHWGRSILHRARKHERCGSQRFRKKLKVPLRKNLKSILLIGSGPIVIGQACEFDYSGTQALKALREEGLRLILINSNPATIMTDPELADRTYIEPMTVASITKIIEKERPDAILPTVGGQTALNLAIELSEAGVLERFNVELIGAKLPAIKKAEDRDLFKAAMIKIGLEVPRSAIAHSWQDAERVVDELGIPLIIRPSRTLGGTGGSIARELGDCRAKVAYGLEQSPNHEVLIEQSVEGWKEFELEVMRDTADNVVIICSIENLDPMGVHTGDSITVAPA